MNRSGKPYFLLATARVANIPSVVSNVWVGMALALFSGGGAIHVSWFTFFQLSFAGAALYVSGNFFNDWMDRDWDAVNRPERALPTGRFNASVYLIVAVQLAVAGLAVAAAVNLPAVMVAGAIVAFVAVYTWIHKKTVWSVIPMGLCRALLPVMGAAGVVGTISSSSFSAAVRAGGIPSIGLFSYIVGLSLVARSESLPGKPGRSSKGLLAIPVVLALLVFFHAGGNPWLMLIGLVPYLLWVAFCDGVRRAQVFRFVSFLLAGIPLVDWIFLMPTGVLAVQRGGWFDPFGTACLLIPALAFVSALLLQRLAPAT